MEISVSDFYHSGCEEQFRLMKKNREQDNLGLARKKIIYRMSQLLIENMPTEKIIIDLKKEMEDTYNESFFSFTFMKHSQIEDDIKAILRFLEYLKPYKVIDIYKKCSVAVSDDISLYCYVDLICMDEKGNEEFFVIHFKNADKSVGGKSEHTRVSSDLYLNVAKASLEGFHPDIKGNLVYLTNSKDSTGNVGDFIIGQTKTSNIFSESFRDFYQNSFFDFDGISSKIRNIFDKKPPKPLCAFCSYSACCNADSVKNLKVNKRQEERQKKLVSSFTRDQQKAIDTTNGYVIAYAGPGGGKTAMMVGRIKKMIKSGIPSEFILAITFTNDAVNEIKERCKSFCDEDSLPKVSTIHSMANLILKMNKDLVGEFRILTQKDQLMLIESLLDVKDTTIKGFSYTVKNGRTGLLETISRAISSYSKDGNSFLDKKGLGKDFICFYEEYQRAIKEQNFVSFDALIPKATQFLYENPDILKKFSSQYKYVMVDEYQDINKEQHDFIELITYQNGNLMVVGDDDQSIYGFRGGSSKYMLAFEKEHPDCKKIILKDNFRSTKEIVDASQKLISQNSERMNKKLLAKKKGEPPKIIDGKGAKELNSLIKSIVNSGYRYSDIFVLATKNDTLKSLQRESDYPSALGKAFLRDNVLFKIIFYTLKLYFEGEDDLTKLSLMKVLGYDNINISNYPSLVEGDYSNADSDDEVEASMMFVNRLIRGMKNDLGALYIIDTVLLHYNAESSTIEDAFMGILKPSMSAYELYEVMKYMIEYNDDTRINIGNDNSVLFITDHESKGLENKVVIMIDDFSTSPDSMEEQRRLYYVAMTRAAEKLYIMAENGKTLLTA